MTWLSTVIFKSSCSIKIRYFPFDEQICEMTFASWTFDGYFLDLNVNSNEGDVTNYIRNGEWHLVNLTAVKNLKNYSCCDEPYPEICYKLVIRRRPLYYVFNLVFPCMLITLVAFLGFYLPPGSTDKVHIGITTLLSITVFLMLVAESMPPTSEQLPLLGIYYAVTIGIVSLSTSMSVITLNINNKGTKGNKVPVCIQLIFFDYLAKFFCIELSNQKILNKKKAYSDFYIQSKRKNYNPFPNMLLETDIYDECSLYEHQKSVSNKNEILEEPCGFNKMKDKTTIYNNLILKSTPFYKNLDSMSTKSFLNKSDTINYKSNSPTMLNYQEKEYLEDNCEGSKEFQQESENAFCLKNQETYKFSKSSKFEKSNQNKTFQIKKHLKQSTSDEETKLKNKNREFIIELEKLLSKQFDPLVKNIVKVIEKNEKTSKEKEILDAIQEEWSDLAMISDHILFYFFSIMTIICCLIIFLNSPHTLPLSQW